MKLYELEKGARIYGLEPAIGEKQYKDAVIVFQHPDGMYSYCTIEEADGTPIEDENGQPAIVHLAGAVPLVSYEDGYKIDMAKLNDTEG